MTPPASEFGRPIRIGIDGSNLRAGGGVTHLRELVRAADPSAYGVERVIVWGGRRLLETLPQASWLTLQHEPALDRSLPARLWWQDRRLATLAAPACDLLFAPGGRYAGQFRPFATMSRNLLPFQREERARYPRSSWMFTKLLLLRRGQTRTLRRAAGVIFPTEFTRRVVSSAARLTTKSRVIPYGVSQPFFLAPRPQRSADPARPYRLLYVSTVDLYKHQWHVATAVASLRRRGLPVTLDLVGHAYPPALDRLTAVCSAIDPAGAFIRYHGPAAYADLPRHYHAADAFVFASSCESMSNVLMEAMAAGLPIACANRGPMPEVLADAGVYFDPEDPASIADVVAGLLASPADRTALAARAFARAGGQSWRRCADETFRFLRDVFDEWAVRAR